MDIVLKQYGADGALVGTSTDFGFRATGFTGAAPEARQVVKSVPHRSGSYDFSSVVGGKHYDDAEFTVEFKRPATAEGNLDALNRMRKWLYGIDCAGEACLYVSILGALHEVSCTKVEFTVAPGNMSTVTATFVCRDPEAVI